MRAVRTSANPVQVNTRAFLGGWLGSLICDDYAGYKVSFGLGVTEAGCLAHARRKFFDLHAANKSQWMRICPACTSCTGVRPNGSTSRSEATSDVARPSNPSSAISRVITSWTVVTLRAKPVTGCMRCCVRRGYNIKWLLRMIAKKGFAFLHVLYLRLCAAASVSPNWPQGLLDWGARACTWPALHPTCERI